MSTLPPAIRDQVRGELGRQFDKVRWEEISSAKASEMYTRFVKDPKIGGLLARYMPPENIRVWIKDGPAKEYRRALEGKGYMAGFTSRAYPGVEAIARSGLGDGWAPILDTVAEKPMRCFAENASGTRQFVLWGPYSSHQSLVWQATLMRAENPDQAIAIIVTRPSGSPLDTEEWRFIEQLARVVGAVAKQVTYEVKAKPSPEAAPTEDGDDESLVLAF